MVGVQSKHDLRLFCSLNLWIQGNIGPRLIFATFASIIIGRIEDWTNVSYCYTLTQTQSWWANIRMRQFVLIYPLGITLSVRLSICPSVCADSCPAINFFCFDIGLPHLGYGCITMRGCVAYIHDPNTTLSLDLKAKMWFLTCLHHKDFLESAYPLLVFALTLPRQWHSGLEHLPPQSEGWVFESQPRQT